MKTIFDKTVLLEKAIILNGMMVNGSSVEKRYAKKEWEKLKPDFQEVLPNVNIGNIGEEVLSIIGSNDER